MTQYQEEKQWNHSLSKANTASDATAVLAAVPDTEEEILRFLDSAVLEEQPTEVLVQLAQKLKDRRSKLYVDVLGSNPHVQQL